MPLMARWRKPCDFVSKGISRFRCIISLLFASELPPDLVHPLRQSERIKSHGQLEVIGH